LPDEVVAQIIERADGVPLFVEELTKSVLESGLLREEGDRYVLDGALPPFAIPTSLHDSLMARLDRLASVQLVAQIGAAIRREFSYPLLRAVSRLDEDELQAALAHLVASSWSSRQQLHAQIAEALEAHSSGLMDSQPELFAQHYAEAGLLKNLPLVGARQVIAPPPARRRRKRPCNSKRRWTSWRRCRLAPNAGRAGDRPPNHYNAGAISSSAKSSSSAASGNQ
jgi:predicted ATPase